MKNVGLQWKESPVESHDWGRQAAKERFQSLDRPTLRDPNYKFLSLDSMDWEMQAEVGRDFHYLPCPYASKSSEEQAVLRLRSSSFESEFEGELPASIVFCDLWKALQTHLPLIESKTAESSDLETDIFAQMAWARWQTGYFIYVPKGEKLDLSLRVLHYFDDSSKAFFFRNVIILEEGAELVLSDDFESEELQTGALSVGSSQIFVGRNAKLRYSQLQNWKPSAESFFRQEINLEEGAEFEQAQMQVGSRKSQYRQILNFKKASLAKSHWSIRSSARQTLDHWIHQNHREASSTNELDFLAALGGSSRVVFNGMQQVEKACRGTDSYQKSKALMLSKRAQFESLPQLLIAHDDVKIAHGSASSSIEMDQLYYLQSRGITQAEAERMIVEGFAEPVLEKFPSSHLKERSRQELRRLAMQERSHES